MAQALGTMLMFIALAGLLDLGPGVASGQIGHPAYVRAPFSAEGQTIRTAACLLVTERTYPQPAWWQGIGPPADAPDRALMATIAAIKHKDRAALLMLSHPTEGRDPKRFDEQANAFFIQFETLNLLAIPRAYEFDGLVVYFAKIQYKERIAFAPLVFASEDDGSFGFLPYQTETLTYRLVRDWFESTWRGGAPTNAVYCTNEEINRATHRISLGSAPAPRNRAGRPSQLFLTGASFDSPGATANLVARTKSSIEELKSAIANGGDFARYMTPEGGRRLKEWFASAGPADRRKYAALVVDQQPFFLFDASPLVVVYTRLHAGVQVLYFTLGSGRELLWTNSSYITEADALYKHGALYDASLLDPPFSRFAIR